MNDAGRLVALASSVMGSPDVLEASTAWPGSLASAALVTPALTCRILEHRLHDDVAPLEACS